MKQLKKQSEISLKILNPELESITKAMRGERLADLQSGATRELNLLWLRISGLLAVDPPSDIVLADINTQVLLKHRSLTTGEIWKAFLMASNDELSVRVDTYGRPLSLPLIHSVLRNYKKYKQDLMQRNAPIPNDRGEPIPEKVLEAWRKADEILKNKLKKFKPYHKVDVRHHSIAEWCEANGIEPRQKINKYVNSWRKDYMKDSPTIEYTDYILMREQILLIRYYNIKSKKT